MSQLPAVPAGVGGDRRPGGGDRCRPVPGAVVRRRRRRPRLHRPAAGRRRAHCHARRHRRTRRVRRGAGVRRHDASDGARGGGAASAARRPARPVTPPLHHRPHLADTGQALPTPRALVEAASLLAESNVNLTGTSVLNSRMIIMFRDTVGELCIGVELVDQV